MKLYVFEEMYGMVVVLALSEDEALRLALRAHPSIKPGNLELVRVIDPADGPCVVGDYFE